MEESASAEIREEADDSIIKVNENSGSEWEANSPTGNESQNGEVGREPNASIENENQDRWLANNITEMLERSEPPLSPECCICRVPHVIRKFNKEAYTPRVISIGPFHRGNKRLETMEMVKVRYCKKFVQKAALNMENLVSIIRGMEGDVRRCYGETSRLSSDNYVKMILLDASFIIVFFLIRCQHIEWVSDDNFTVFRVLLTSTVTDDMLLLENQLPFFAIEKLYNCAFASRSNYPSFTLLTFKYFAYYNTQKMSPNDPNLKIMHFVDLLRTFFLPPSQRGQAIKRDKPIKHLYTASQLHEAGVKFKVGSSECLFDFKFRNGALEIPCLQLVNRTEFIFRILLALEQCCYPYDAYVTDYVMVMDFLINTVKDVDLLVQKGIVVNWLGDHDAVTTLVNNLLTRTIYTNMNSDYCDLCKDLNTFYEDPRHSWKATLRRDYFSTPWRIASTVAAIILLVLTFIQTVRSFY